MNARRRALQKDIEAFMASGGLVDHVPPEATARDTDPEASSRGNHAFLDLVTNDPRRYGRKPRPASATAAKETRL
jgi:hypothetical protein